MIFSIILLVLFYFLIDCDLVTYFYHFYRLRFVKDGYYNKTLWIVGASSGLGETLCYEAVRSLAKSIIISARRVNELERVKQRCNQIDPKCKIIIKPLDLLEFTQSSEAASNFMQEEILGDSAIEDINILIVNAGVSSRHLALETDISVPIRLFNVNVLGPFSLIQSFVNSVPILSSRALKKAKKSTRRGSVSQPLPPSKQIPKLRSVFITSSLSGKIGAPGQAAYSMSKHAINGLLEGMRVELNNKNVHLGIICPGRFELNENSLDGIGANINEPSGRTAKLDDKNFKNKMTLKRLSELYTTAILCNLSECWIANNPELFFIYVKQYLPWIVPFAFKYIGPKILKQATKLVGKGKDNNNNKNEHKRPTPGGDIVTTTRRDNTEERKKDD